MNTTAQLIVVGLLTFIVGLLVGQMVCGTGGVDVRGAHDRSTVESMSTEETDTRAEAVSASDNGGFTIDVHSLPEAQQMALRAAGVHDSQIYISAETIACAEIEIGASRVEEIKNGATPSISEGAKLMGCI